MDLDFELKGNVAVGNQAQIVYASRHESYLHLVLRDKNGDLYPTRYNLWDVTESVRLAELSKLQHLVNALRIPLLKNTNQLIGDAYITFSTLRESNNALWFMNPCLPDSHPVESDPIKDNKPHFETEVLTPDTGAVYAEHQEEDDLPPPPRSPVSAPMPDGPITADTGAVSDQGKSALSGVNWDVVGDD